MEPFRPEIVPGDRVFLSHFHAEDAAPTAKWMSDLEVTTHLGAFSTFSVEDQVEWLERARRDRFNPTFAIVLREGAKLIGSISLKDVNARRGGAEVGILVGKKSEWGKGYGTEALRLVADYAFTMLDLQTLHLWHWSFNERGRRAYLKAGFKDAGRIRSAIGLAGKRYDNCLMDLTRDDFGPSKLRERLRLASEA